LIDPHIHSSNQSNRQVIPLGWLITSFLALPNSLCALPEILNQKLGIFNSILLIVTLRLLAQANLAKKRSFMPPYPYPKELHPSADRGSETTWEQRP